MKAVLKVIAGAVVFIILMVVVLMATLPKYRVYKQNLAGQATLREAEWTKKITIESAKAKKESATLLADAEVERAKGVAKANKIIGDSLKDNEGYLRYLWIDSLTETDNQVIYVPTEGGLPILEAGKR
jgi:regulator of protease activity HflC (stomatin/prohibitin superfamily)